MAVRVTCPECESTFRVLREKLGKTLRCSHCSSKFKAAESDDAPRKRKSFQLPASPKALISIASLFVVAIVLFLAKDRIAAMLQKAPEQRVAVQPTPVSVPPPAEKKHAAPPSEWDAAPAMLKAAFADKERTCAIESKHVASSKGKTLGEEAVSGSLLEKAGTETNGVRIQIVSGNLQLQGFSGTRRFAFTTKGNAKLQGFGPHYVGDVAGLLTQRKGPDLPSDASGDLRETLLRAASAYELVSPALPNRSLKSGETWTSRQRSLAPLASIGRDVELDLVFTYQGQKNDNGRRIASATFEGRVLADRDEIGSAKGKGLIDLEGGYFASVELHAEMTTKPEDGSEQHHVADVKLVRSPGNPQSIVPAKIEPVILSVEGLVSPLDPPFLKRQPFRHKLQPVNLRADKAYAIIVESVTTPSTPAFRPYLAVLDPQGALAFDNFREFEVGEARVNFEPQQTGTFAVVVGTRSNFAGAFRILIREVERSKND